MRIKQMTAALCAYTILGSSLAFAAPTANDRASAVLNKTRISKNQLVYTQLEEIGRIRESVQQLNKVIQDHIDGDFSMHSISQVASLAAIAGVMLIPIANKAKAKEFLGFAAGGAALYGAQALISSYGKSIEEKEVKALEETISALTDVVTQLEGEHLDTVELTKLRATLEDLTLEHKKIQETGFKDGFVITAGYALSAVHAIAGFIALFGVSGATTYGVDRTTITLLIGSLAMLVGSGTGMMENITALPNRIGNEDFEDITRDVETINTRLDNMVMRLEKLL